MSKGSNRVVCLSPEPPNVKSMACSLLCDLRMAIVEPYSRLLGLYVRIGLADVPAPNTDTKRIPYGDQKKCGLHSWQILCCSQHYIARFKWSIKQDQTGSAHSTVLPSGVCIPFFHGLFDELCRGAIRPPSPEHRVVLPRHLSSTSRTPAFHCGLRHRHLVGNKGLDKDLQFPKKLYDKCTTILGTSLSSFVFVHVMI